MQPVPGQAVPARDGQPETRGRRARPSVETPYVNAIDAAAAGAADGLRLALNVAAMLIAFIAFVALFNALLGSSRLLVGAVPRTGG